MFSNKISSSCNLITRLYNVWLWTKIWVYGTLIWTIIYVCWFQQDQEQTDSDSEQEPSPEALAKYLQIRRHTLGVTDPSHEVNICVHGVWSENIVIIQLLVLRSSIQLYSSNIIRATIGSVISKVVIQKVRIVEIHPANDVIMCCVKSASLWLNFNHQLSNCNISDLWLHQ